MKTTFFWDFIDLRFRDLACLVGALRILNSATFCGIIALAFLALSTTATFAQVGLKVEEFDAKIGTPVKEHRENVPAPTNIYHKDGLQLQAALKNGSITGCIYHKITAVGAAKKPLSESDIKRILEWNAITAEDMELVIEKKGKKVFSAKGKKFLVVNDTVGNMYTVLDSAAAAEYYSK